MSLSAFDIIVSFFHNNDYFFCIAISGRDIGKLKKEPKYLKYKISSLAEEIGFSSQSKFAAAFKKVTSVSPSEFIKHLKENG
ncbi:helix-turn-helix transcriptional regulator [Chryseobacterium sp. POL2]|uniref:helix-turn-helix domain-containing protein n=1 Tax=Chryseobacterium sp. POL2 TaxID=2713414 RepID=UPI0013E20054|nr:AraC family transcriptional regulator [Chryseobacterium sp. POL2]QIG90980.1 helix-turn-helix transcriptional regulator [Chryseobacterium sp. POL2]